jgi:hypothetical protein
MDMGKNWDLPIKDVQCSTSIHYGLDQTTPDRKMMGVKSLSRSIPIGIIVQSKTVLCRELGFDGSISISGMRVVVAD